MDIKKISLVIPCYNEEAVLDEFYKRVTAVAQSSIPTYVFEFIFVNDGSSDNTPIILNRLAERDQHVKVLHFARNQGHQAALTAGLDFAGGDLIVTIDADLQDPPELLTEMLHKVNEGYDVVHAQRKMRSGENRFKLLTAWGYYKLMSFLTNEKIIKNCGDFRAFTRPVLRTIQNFRERHRFLRGIFSTIGFKQCVIQYDRDERYAGETKYSLKKMLSFAINGILSFSSSPIKTISGISLVLWISSLIYLVKALIEHFVFNETVKGWTSIIFLLTFFTGLILFCLSIIGAYVARIFEQNQKRPLYWLSDVKNIDLNRANSNIEEVKISKNIFRLD